jgi:NifB/MoaA-like Fe-S oxidoreductase
MVERLKGKFPRIHIHLYPIRNDFFGERITVSGLITGQDILAQLKGKELGTRLLIPCNMLRDGEEVFLDDVMGELDENRQRFVFDIIRNMQVFITTPNERTLLPDIKGKILRISGGRIAEELR